MSIGIVDKKYLQNIADAIRTALVESGTMTLAEMPSKIQNIQYAFNDINPVDIVENGVSKYMRAMASATKIRDYAFYGCTDITYASFPNCSWIGNQAFARCHNMSTVYFPQCSYIGGTAFYYCGFATASFPMCSLIEATAFRWTNISTIYLMSAKTVTLKSTDVFSTTPIDPTYSGSTQGYIYVPSSMVTIYQSATNWTYYSSRFVGI